MFCSCCCVSDAAPIHYDFLPVSFFLVCEGMGKIDSGLRNGRGQYFGLDGLLAGWLSGVKVTNMFFFLRM